MLSTRTWRTTPRAPASSLISTTFLVVRRLTMASAIRSATISSRRGIRTHTTRPRRGESRNARQRERHARAGVARALDVDHAAVSLDQRLDDGEPETGAADRAGRGSPIIRLEDPRERVARNAGGAVEYRDLDHRAGAAGTQPHLAAGRRVFHGVGDEVGQDALEGVRVGVHWRQRGRAIHDDRVRDAAAEEVGGRDERGLHRHRHAVERRLETALNAREIEQVADDPPEARRLGAHDPGHPPHLLRRERARREDLAESLERGERCPKLVRGDGDEGGLRPVQLFETTRRARDAPPGGGPRQPAEWAGWAGPGGGPGGAPRPPVPAGPSEWSRTAPAAGARAW